MRSRDGGFVGKSVDATPSNAAATGVWTIDECRQWMSASKWPFRSITFTGWPTEEVDVSTQVPQEAWSFEVYFYSGYSSLKYKWEHLTNGQWIATPVRTVSSQVGLSRSVSYSPSDYNVGEGRFGAGRYRLLIDTGLKEFRSPEIEVVSFEISNFVWVQHPSDAQAQPGQQTQWFFADGRGYAPNGREYFAYQMSCQWEISADGGTTWQDIPVEAIGSSRSTSLLFTAGADTYSQSGRKYRLRVTLPSGAVYRSNVATLTVA